jgi:uncharacterized membrane protein
MRFIQQPAYIIAILLLLVVFSEWLAQKKYFKQAGAVIIIIVAAAIFANLNIIPSSHNAPALYSRIFEYAAPLGIFFLLLQVKLKDLKFAGMPMMLMFFVGSFATIAGVVIGYWLFSPQQHDISQAHAIAGMYTGTYIGGSANLNAVALHYEVNKDGTLFAAVNAVDNIVGTPWMLMTILLPPILQKFFPRKKSLAPELKGYSDEELRSMATHLEATMNLKEIALLLALGFGTLFISILVTKLVPQVPTIITLTTLALIFAQLPFIQKLRGSKMLGMLLIMLFLAVIGAFCDLQALLNSGSSTGTLLIWVLSIILIHAIIIFVVGGIFKQDWDIVSIASNANIGGSTSAPVCAASLGRPDLQLPGLLAGSVGNAIGTYLGILVAGFLK